MRTTEKCPKCQSNTIWVIERVQQHDPDNSGQAAPVALTVGRSVSGDLVDAGLVEAWICAQCGFMELYAKNFHEKLSVLAAHGWNGVRLINRGDRGGPFR